MTTTLVRHRTGPILAAALPFLCTAPASAQAYPNHPNRLVVSFPPGGTTDVVGRRVANKLSEKLGQQVFVENKAGAGGIIGTDSIAKSPPDGYNLLLSSSTLATYSALYHKLPFDALKDLEPIGFVVSMPSRCTITSTPPNQRCVLHWQIASCPADAACVQDAALGRQRGARCGGRVLSPQRNEVRMAPPQLGRAFGPDPQDRPR